MPLKSAGLFGGLRWSLLGRGSPLASRPYTGEDLRKLLAQASPSGARFGFQGLRAADAIAVEECVPLEFLIACDWGLDGPRWDARLRYFSVERGNARRIVWTHGSLVDAYGGPLGAEFRQFLGTGGAPRLIVPYRSTEFLEKLAEEGRLSILANPLGLKTRLDDKIAFREEAERCGLAVPPGQILEVGALEEGILRRWGPEVVVTERIGSSGNQTHLVASAGELAALRARLCEKLGKDAWVIASRYLRGPAVGATAFIYGGRAWMSHPSVMATGLAGCAMHRFDYAGSDYGAYGRLPRAARAGIESATLQIGRWAAGLGYAGIFGVDFIVHGGESYALELNPRLLGTTQLLTELERRAGPPPPSAFWHLAAFLAPVVEEAEAARQIAAQGLLRLAGFQLLLRNTGTRPLRVGRSSPPGVYGMMDASPRLLRDGDRIAALQGPDEVLLTCSPPARGTIVEARGVFFKLEGLGSLYEEGVERIAPWVGQMVEAFTRQLELSAAS